MTYILILYVSMTFKGAGEYDMNKFNPAIVQEEIFKTKAKCKSRARELIEINRANAPSYKTANFSFQCLEVLK